MSFEEFVAFDIESSGRKKSNQITAVGYAARQNGKTRGKTYNLNQISEEPQLIRKLVECLENTEGPIFTYNGTKFDFKLMKNRCKIHMEMDDLKQRIEELENRHVDMIDIDERVNGEWQGLEDYAEDYGIIHDFDCDGEEAVRLYQRGNWSELDEYLKEDVRVTFELAEAIIRERVQLVEYQYSSPVAST